jgi:hypothetical protein
MRVMFRLRLKAVPNLRMNYTAADVTGGAIHVRDALTSQSCNHALRPMIFLQETSEVKKMEYLIAFSVVAIMSLYVLIIARCLREPEWQ